MGSVRRVPISHHQREKIEMRIALMEEREFGEREKGLEKRDSNFLKFFLY